MFFLDHTHVGNKFFAKAQSDVFFKCLHNIYQQTVVVVVVVVAVVVVVVVVVVGGRGGEGRGGIVPIIAVFAVAI